MHSCERLSDVPVEVLCRLLREQGPGLFRAGGRCGAILADMCGAYRQEVFILDCVIRKGLFAAKPQAGIPLEEARDKFAQQISDQLRFDTEAARWAASAWASLYEVSLTSQAANNETRARSSCASSGLHTAQSIGALHQDRRCRESLSQRLGRGSLPRQSSRGSCGDRRSRLISGKR